MPKEDEKLEKLKLFEKVAASKKNPFQKHREELEAKRKKAEEEAAEAYAEFVESFKVEDKPAGQTFVRGGIYTEGGGIIPATSPTTSTTSSTYTPTSSSPNSSKRKRSNWDSAPPNGEPGKTPPSKPSEEETSQDPKKRKKNIDAFLDELKRKQDIKDGKIPASSPVQLPLPSSVSESSSHRPGRGGRDDHMNFDDQATTNLYVANLAPDVTEEMVMSEFGKFGAIGSIKIMWPRTEEERKRGRNCGFVAFIERKDAEAAMREMRGTDCLGSGLHIGWGKPVPRPAKPLTLSATGQMRGGWTEAPMPVIPAHAPRVEVAIPDAKTKLAADQLALLVSQDGVMLEQWVMDKERGSPLFEWLYHEGPALTYYRWKVYSLAQGDTIQQWHMNPFQMISAGPFWIPPPISSGSETSSSLSSDSRTHSRDRDRDRDRDMDKDRRRDTGRDRDRERSSDAEKSKERKERGHPLSEQERDEWEGLLRKVTTSRKMVREAMAFALDHAEQAIEVVQVLTEALTLTKTPIPKKIGRLYVLSDILHNCSAPVKNASAYRGALESKLPEVFESLHQTYAKCDGRMTAEAMKEKVLSVLRVWQAWSIYFQPFLARLENIFLGKPDSQSAGGNQGVGDDELDGMPLDAGTGESAASRPAESGGHAHADEKPVFSAAEVESDDDLDGQPLGEPLVLGTKHADDDDIDGTPLF